MRQLAGLVVAAGMLAARTAQADPDAAPGTADEIATAADRLFEDGRKLAKDNHAAEACKRFEQSYALRHTFGTAVNLGDCARHDGHLGLAWQRYHEAVLAAEHDGADRLAQFARDRAAAVAPALCTVLVTVSSRDLGAVTVRIADHEAAPSTPPARWAALVDPGQIDVEIDGMAGGSRVTRTVPCTAAGEVATVELHDDGVPGASLAELAPAAVAEPRAADLSLGIGYLPEQGAGASLAFGATVELWSWPQLAIAGHLAGAVFRTRPFMEHQQSVRQTGTIGFIGPALRYAPAPRLWLAAGAGVAAGFWVGGDSTRGALRPSLDLGAGYWVAHALNISIDGFGFLDPGAHAGSISVMMGARLH